MAALRGYAKWNPKPETLYWVHQVSKVLDEYEDYLPITLRQVFYDLVSRGYEKSEEAYGRLGTWVARARRAQMLPFDAFSDEQGRAHEVMAWASADGFWEDVEENFEHYRRHRMNGQPIRVEVWSEATGIGKQLQRVAWRYGIPVYISRGYTSVTNIHALAERAMKFDGHTVILHIGDYDPSGVGLFESLGEDVTAFVAQKRAWADREVVEDGRVILDKLRDSGPWVRTVRVALTPEQIDEHGIETAPPKPAPRRGAGSKKGTDSRSASWVGESAQAEALPPDLLAQIVAEAIEAELDMDRFREEVAKEDADKEAIRRVLDEGPASREDDDG